MRENSIRPLINRLNKLLDNSPIEPNGLAFGKSGLAFCKFYLGAYLLNEEDTTAGMKLIEEIFDDINRKANLFKSMDYFNGYTGFLSVLDNLNQNNLLDIDFSAFANLEKRVFEWTIDQLTLNNVDFFYGAMGSFSYLVNRPADEKIISYNKQIADHLASLLTVSPFNAVVNKYYNKLNQRVLNEINYSLAHGMSSVVLNLIRLYEKAPGTPQLYETITYTINSIVEINHRFQSENSKLCFVGCFDLDNGAPIYQRRLGWCFSDINIIHLLYKGGIVLDNNRWTNIADEKSAILLKRKSDDDTRVSNPFLCHGSLGLSHYFKKLFELTGHTKFQAAELFWLKRGLRFFEENDDTYFFSTEYLKTSHVNSFFYGVPGILLCLLSSLDPSFSNWSSIILL